MSRSILATVTLALLAAGAPAVAGEEGGTEPAKKVYTNADLERRYGAPSPPAQDEAGEEQARFGEQALEGVLSGTDDDLPLRRAHAEKLYREAVARVDYLKRKVASIRNPLLPRPEPTEEDAVEEAGMDNTARLARTLDQKTAAEARLARAREVLLALGSSLPGAPARPDERPEAGPAGRPEPRSRTVAGGGG
jgi:hypothetical protein